MLGGTQQSAPDEHRYNCGGGAEIIDIAAGEARFVGDDIWELVAQGRRAAALPGGDVLVVGSRSATSGGPWLERFDHTSELFSLLAEGDVRVLYPAVIPLDDGRIFNIGSSPSSTAAPSEDPRRTWYFDPSDDSLEEGPRSPRSLRDRRRCASTDRGCSCSVRTSTTSTSALRRWSSPS